MNANKSVFAIVPCFNEGEVIRRTVVELLDQGYAVAIVDDASKDNTRTVLKGLPVSYIRHAVNLGQGAALRTGINFALRSNAKFVATFDGDGQHNADDLGRMLQLLVQTKAEIVFGSRFLAGSRTNMSPFRKLVLKSARFFNYFVSGILLSDANNGIRVMTRYAAEKLLITENRSTHSAQIQNLVNIYNLKYAECPVNVSYTEYSIKKGLKNSASIRILLDLMLFKIFR